MVGAQQKVPFVEIAIDDQDARDVIAFGRSCAGKLEETCDLTQEEKPNEEAKKDQTSSGEKPRPMTEEDQLREDI